MRPALLRRRSVWLPTLWGWLLLLALISVATVMVARNLHGFLALNEPVGARVLVIEGWLSAEQLRQAVAAFRSGGYELIVTTGAPIEYWPGQHGRATLAERAADYLLQQGVPEASVVALPAPASAQDRTFVSALMVRDWAKRSRPRLDALDVYSAGTHARRSRLLYQLALGPDVRVGVMAARSSEYDPRRWWRSSTGARDVLDQAIGFLWVKLFFRVPRQGSHAEFWQM